MHIAYGVLIKYWSLRGAYYIKDIGEATAIPQNRVCSLIFRLQIMSLGAKFWRFQKRKFRKTTKNKK